MSILYAVGIVAFVGALLFSMYSTMKSFSA